MTGCTPRAWQACHGARRGRGRGWNRRLNSYMQIDNTLTWLFVCARLRQPRVDDIEDLWRGNFSYATQA